MRRLLFVLLSLSLVGCVPSNPDTNNNFDNNKLPAKLYKNRAELGNRAFTPVGDVSGASCQTSMRDTPPNITEARHDMLMRASRMNANAVILDNCEMIGNVPGCYRQAMCRGSAINVASQ